MGLDTQDARSRDRNLSNFTLDYASNLSANQAEYVGLENFKVFILATAAAAFVYIFNTLSATRVLNSYEELCITLGAADNSFARVLNPHGGAYILSSTDRLFRSIRTLQCGLTRRTLEAGIETRPTKLQTCRPTKRTTLA